MDDMSRRDALKLAAAGVAAATGGAAATAEGRKPTEAGSVDADAVRKILGKWPARPRLAAFRTIDKYGPPQEDTPFKLIWHGNGPWKKTVVTRKEIPHDFPKIHMDYVEQTIDYRVPAEKADELVGFDGSVTVDRTAGEVSSRCNMEEANFLTVNLVHDILTGKKTVEEARKAFGQNEVDFALGKDPAYMKALQFKPPERAADPDKPVVAGSPRRAGDDKGMNDGEVLGFVIAIHENEIEAAADAAKKKTGAEFRKFARMLHEDHGKALEATMKLGQRIGVTPLETAAVDKLRVEAAGHLAELVQLKGDAFARAYVEQSVKGHAKVLETIDDRLLKSARDAELLKLLKAMRGEVDAHLKEARRVEASLKR